VACLSWGGRNDGDLDRLTLGAAASWTELGAAAARTELGSGSLAWITRREWQWLGAWAGLGERTAAPGQDLTLRLWSGGILDK
jgi:hypothetical protein